MLYIYTQVFYTKVYFKSLYSYLEVDNNLRSLVAKYQMITNTNNNKVLVGPFVWKGQLKYIDDQTSKLAPHHTIPHHTTQYC